MFAFGFRISTQIRIATLAIAVVAAPAVVLADDHHPFLDRFDSVSLIASTVPSIGDVNPYGIVVVPRSVGLLKGGHVLISNFNNSGNAQGTGTTIVQVSPKGELTLFAQIDPSTVTCPGGVGLTTALVVLMRGWVIVGSLPTSNGTSETAAGGCLIVLNSVGQVVETFFGGNINGPWDMTALDGEDEALLFVTNVLNGDVTTDPPHVVNQGTVVRIDLDIPEHGKGMPKMRTATVIGSGFAEKADSNALVIGPTGVGLADDDTLYVADTLNNRIAAIPHALTRNTSALTGTDVSINGALNAPLGLTIAPNGHIITANGGDGNLVETTPAGSQVGVETVETATGAGSLFGIAVIPGRRGVYFVDDGDNTLKAFTFK
jgi:hypothetical protein